MSTLIDAELTALAAKAAGIDFTIAGDDQNIRTMVFDPLHNDGDALRLAATLKISISFYDFLEGVAIVVRAPADNLSVMEFIRTDGCISMRSAIVTIASEIGRRMCPANQEES